MKVSVVIPIYNVQYYIDACLCSVAAQTFRDFEVILVDDCCTDFSMEVAYACLETHKKDFPHVKIIHHDWNRGLSAARNTGIKASEGDYVYFLDSDDTITPDCLKRLVKASRWGWLQTDMVVGNYCFDGPELGCPHIHTKKPLLTHSGYIRAYCKQQIFPMAWNRLVRRQFILEHNLFFEEGLIHEDTLWSFQILQFVKWVGVVRSETYVYRVRQNSIQSSLDFERHFRANSYIVGRLADVMFSSSLRTNRYVYNFVEQEKLRHLYDCYRSGNMHLARQLYTVCREKPHYQPQEALRLFGRHARIRKCIQWRDSHYDLPFEDGLKKFVSLPSGK